MNIGNAYFNVNNNNYQKTTDNKQDNEVNKRAKILASCDEFKPINTYIAKKINSFLTEIISSSSKPNAENMKCYETLKSFIHFINPLIGKGIPKLKDVWANFLNELDNQDDKIMIVLQKPNSN